MHFLLPIFQTATSIGKNKRPTNILEIIFMTASWLMGVFVFAILIGDIRDIVGNARKNALDFQHQLDNITTYMNNNKVAKNVQVYNIFPELLCCGILGNHDNQKNTPSIAKNYKNTFCGNLYVDDTGIHIR